MERSRTDTMIGFTTPWSPSTKKLIVETIDAVAALGACGQNYEKKLKKDRNMVEQAMGQNASWILLPHGTILMHRWIPDYQPAIPETKEAYWGNFGRSYKPTTLNDSKRPVTPAGFVQLMLTYFRDSQKRMNPLQYDPFLENQDIYIHTFLADEEANIQILVAVTDREVRERGENLLHAFHALFSDYRALGFDTSSLLTSLLSLLFSPPPPSPPPLPLLPEIDSKICLDSAYVLERFIRREVLELKNFPSVLLTLIIGYLTPEELATYAPHIFHPVLDYKWPVTDDGVSVVY